MEVYSSERRIFIHEKRHCSPNEFRCWEQIGISQRKGGSHLVRSRGNYQIHQVLKYRLNENGDLLHSLCVILRYLLDPSHEEEDREESLVWDLLYLCRWQTRRPIHFGTNKTMGRIKNWNNWKIIVLFDDLHLAVSEHWDVGTEWQFLQHSRARCRRHKEQRGSKHRPDKRHRRTFFHIYKIIIKLMEIILLKFIILMIPNIK